MQVVLSVMRQNKTKTKNQRAKKWKNRSEMGDL